MVVCKKVIYSGHVQGVGFRYTVRELASGLDVAGYVKNLRDGDVELVAEGEAEQVDALLERIAKRMARHIQDIEVTEQPAGGHQGFHVRF